MRSREDITKHPCYMTRGVDILSHRSGGMFNTCERCGTPIEGPNNEETGEINWEPIPAPKPFQPESLERQIFDLLGETSAPLHREWRVSLAKYLAKHL